MPRCAGAGAEVERLVDLRGGVGRQHQTALVAALEGDGANLGGAQQLGRSGSGSAPPGTASAASAASWAAVRRSLSQVMRKLATDGTKISTSASMTKVIVKSRSLADKPKPRRSDVAVSGDPIDLTRCQSLADQARVSPMLSRGTPYSRSSHGGSP